MSPGVTPKQSGGSEKGQFIDYWVGLRAVWWETITYGSGKGVYSGNRSISLVHLLGAGLLYTGSGITSLDSVYSFFSMYMASLITNISEPIFTTYSLYIKPEILGMGFLIISVGYLFKISAAPFHFWSPERRYGKSSIFGNKLPNSGNILELLIPNSNRKITSGWINNSCMVTSQKASEKNVDNRGSKSTVLNAVVKEQRVYGSWYGNPLPYLRCTLMGFERNYPVKALSTLIIQRRLYSSPPSPHNPDSNINYVPVKLYSFEDLNLSKEKIKKDNKNKSGIYMWINLKSGSRYVGSSVNLWTRLSRFYLNEYSLKNYKTGKSYISSALLKYKHEAFNLVILEYCEPSNCIEREQYYIDLLKPEYNILKLAGSSLGHIYSEETKEKMRKLRSENLAGRIKVIVEVLDIETGIKTVYSSMSEAAKGLGVFKGTLSNYILRGTQTPFKGRYKIFKVEEEEEPQDVNLITKHSIYEINEPWFITGFADAEGCFAIIIRKSSKNNLGWQLEANFIINLHKKDLELLKLIQNYFGGRIGKERNGCCDLTVSSLDLILTKVIPHFDKYPLKTQKHADYLLFKEVVMMMKRKEHLTAEGLQKIINIRATINKGLSPLLKEAFPNSVAVPRPQVTQSSIHPQWVAGFTSGDGCFKVNIRNSKACKLGNRVNIIFVLTQHIRDELLLKVLIDFFECGQTHTEFICQSFNKNYEKILPFFRKYPILGIKSQDFEDWAKVAEMIKTKAHLNNEGFNQICKIRAGMNKSRSIE